MAKFLLLNYKGIFHLISLCIMFTLMWQAGHRSQLLHDFGFQMFVLFANYFVANLSLRWSGLEKSIQEYLKSKNYFK